MFQLLTDLVQYLRLWQSPGLFDLVVADGQDSDVQRSETL